MGRGCIGRAGRVQNNAVDKLMIPTSGVLVTLRPSKPAASSWCLGSAWHVVFHKICKDCSVLINACSVSRSKNQWLPVIRILLLLWHCGTGVAVNAAPASWCEWAFRLLTAQSCNRM